MTKPTYWVCDQHGSRPACASAQSGQDPYFSLSVSLLVIGFVSEQHGSWSDCADAQAGLDPCWSQTHNVGFVVTRLKCILDRMTHVISDRLKKDEIVSTLCNSVHVHEQICFSCSYERSACIKLFPTNIIFYSQMNWKSIHTAWLFRLDYMKFSNINIYAMFQHFIVNVMNVNNYYTLIYSLTLNLSFRYLYPIFFKISVQHAYFK
jgi:hypothetical protein